MVKEIRKTNNILLGFMLKKSKVYSKDKHLEIKFNDRNQVNDIITFLSFHSCFVY